MRKYGVALLGLALVSCLAPVALAQKTKTVVLIVSALTFFPALSLGPILEHLMMHAGKVF